MGSTCCDGGWAIQNREPCDEDLRLLLIDQNKVIFFTSLHFVFSEVHIIETLSIVNIEIMCSGDEETGLANDRNL